MKAISIRQPFAALIVAGVKDIENRSWPTTFRGRILIHAAQKIDMDALELIRRMGLGHDFIESIKEYTGGVIGEAEIVDCVKESTSQWFESGGYGFVLKNSRILPFYPCKGRSQSS